MSEITLVIIGVISLCLTIMGMVGGGIWVVATVKATTSQLVTTVQDLTASVKGLTARIDILETDHKDTQERIAALEQSKQ